MTRAQKISLLAGGLVAGLLAIVVIAGIVIVSTQKFRNFVRAKIVAEVEQATGGRVEVGSFDFEWQHLRADVRDFVIHGLESPNEAPLLRASHLQVDLKPTAPFKGFIDIAYLLVDTPQANIIVYADGHTNIPAPKLQRKNNQTGLQAIVDLAIGHFELRNGSAANGERKTNFSASGENLRAQLGYARLPAPHYIGELDTRLRVASGKEAPVNAAIKLPVTLEADKVTLTNAEVTTARSHVVVSVAMDHLVAPRVSAHLNAQVAVDEVRRAAGLTMTLDTGHAPKMVDADITASMDENRIQLQSTRITYGASSIDASGTLEDQQKPGSLQFRSTLALGEIGRLLRVAAGPEGAPEGTVRVGGNATLRPNGEYLVTANVDARNVAVTEGTTRIAGIELDSSVTADPHRIELGGLRLEALGGSFNGSAGIEEMAQFHVSGNLRNFDIDRVARVLMHGGVGYSGIVSGLVQA